MELEWVGGIFNGVAAVTRLSGDGQEGSSWHCKAIDKVIQCVFPQFTARAPDDCVHSPNRKTYFSSM
jgi:hypothetical protein